MGQGFKEEINKKRRLPIFCRPPKNKSCAPPCNSARRRPSKKQCRLPSPPKSWKKRRRRTKAVLCVLYMLMSGSICSLPVHSSHPSLLPVLYLPFPIPLSASLYLVALQQWLSVSVCYLSHKLRYLGLGLLSRGLLVEPFSRQVRGGLQVGSLSLSMSSCW